ncbi:MAG: efflux RND transporter permease subunit, partial [Gammaproteobacteria bacterium]
VATVSSALVQGIVLVTLILFVFMGGLAIAIGMLVDGTLVMVENVDRLLREADPNEPRLHVVGRACREVGKPIVFAIAIIVFLPLFTLESVAGKTFIPLAFTVVLAMLGSRVCRKESVRVWLIDRFLLLQNLHFHLPWRSQIFAPR